MVGPATHTYRKLAGSSLGWAGPVSLWMADDHLLYITGYFSEEYRRFYFNEIEAFIIQRNNARLVQTILLTLAGILSLVPFFFMPASYRLLGLVPVVLFALAIIINQLRGAGCSCRLVTRVNDQAIRCLDRERLALKTYETLQPVLLATQGELTGNEVSTPRPVSAVPPAARKRGIPARPQSAVFHVLACICLLGLALVSGASLAYHHAAVSGLGLILYVILLLFILMSLLRQARSEVPQNIKRWTWAVFIFLMITSMLGYIYFIVASIKSAGTYTSEYEVLRAALQQAPQSSPLLFGMYILSCSGSLLLSLVGVPGLVSFYSTRAGDPAGAAVPGPAPDAGGEA